MLVEVNNKGKTHSEHAPPGSTSQPCTAYDMTFGYCLNCGWRPFESVFRSGLTAVPAGVYLPGVLSCPTCANFVKESKGMPDECPVCKLQKPAWRSCHHPRFGLNGD